MKLITIGVILITIVTACDTGLYRYPQMSAEQKVNLNYEKAKPEDDQQKLQWTKAAIEEQEWHYAAKFLAQVESKEAPFYFYLAQLMVAADSLEQAYAHIIKAIEKDPLQLQYAQYYVQLALENEDVINAYKASALLRKIQINNPFLDYVTALYLLHNKEYDSAQYLLASLSDTYFATDERYILARKQLFQNKNKPDSLIAVMLQLKELYPDDLELEGELIMLYVAQNENIKAIDQMKAWLKVNPDLDAYTTFLRISIEAQYFSLAGELVTEMANKFPGSESALLSIARYYDRRYAYDRAAEYYQKLLKVNPQHENALAELENVNRKIAYLRRQREYEKEREELTPIQPIRINY